MLAGSRLQPVWRTTNMLPNLLQCFNANGNVDANSLSKAERCSRGRRFYTFLGLGLKELICRSARIRLQRSVISQKHHSIRLHLLAELSFREYRSLLGSRSLDRESNIVLCQRRSSGLRTRHIVQLRDLQSMLKFVRSREAMHHRREPPGEACGLPYAPQCGGRILVEKVISVRLVKRSDRTCQDLSIRGR